MLLKQFGDSLPNVLLTATLMPTAITLIAEAKSLAVRTRA